MVRQGWLQRGRKRGRTRGKRREREAQEVCSCASILNNHVCVRALVHHRRAASVVVVRSQYKNKPSFLSHCWSNLTPLLTKRQRERPRLFGGHRYRSNEPFSKHHITDRHAVWNYVVCKVKRHQSPEKLNHERFCVLTAGWKAGGRPPHSVNDIVPYRHMFLCIQHEEFLTCTTSFHWFSNDVLSSLYISVCRVFLVCTEGVGR